MWFRVFYRLLAADIQYIIFLGTHSLISRVLSLNETNNIEIEIYSHIEYFLYLKK